MCIIVIEVCVHEDQCYMFLFFFKQKTAYEMRISDWSSDVCSSDLEVIDRLAERHDVPVMVSTHPRTRKRIDVLGRTFHPNVQLMKPLGFHDHIRLQQGDRKSVV